MAASADVRPSSSSARPRLPGQKIETEKAGGIHTAKRASVTIEQACQLWYTHREALIPPIERTTLECINRRVDGGMEWPIKVVSERLGHASIRMTADRYGHLFPRGDDSAELKAADAMFFGNVPAPRPATAAVTMLKPVDNTVPADSSLALVEPVPLPIPIGEPTAAPPVALPMADDELVPAVGSASPRERAKAAILAYPNLDNPAIAKKIGVSLQTMNRAREKQPGDVAAETTAAACAVSPTAVPPAAEPTKAAPLAHPTVPNRTARGQFLPGPWHTPEMERVEAAVLANPGMPTNTLARQIGVGKTAVLRAKRRLNPDENPICAENRTARGQFSKGPWHTPGMARVEAAVLANPGMSCQAIAEQIGVSKTTVLNARRRLGEKSIWVENRTAGMARVEAAVLANPGMSAQALANKIGVGKTTVKRARQRLKSTPGENSGPQP
jgi:transposase